MVAALNQGSYIVLETPAWYLPTLERKNWLLLPVPDANSYGQSY